MAGYVARKAKIGCSLEEVSVAACSASIVGEGVRSKVADAASAGHCIAEAGVAAAVAVVALAVFLADVPVVCLPARRTASIEAVNVVAWQTGEARASEVAARPTALMTGLALV